MPINRRPFLKAPRRFRLPRSRPAAAKALAVAPLLAMVAMVAMAAMVVVVVGIGGMLSDEKERARLTAKVRLSMSSSRSSAVLLDRHGKPLAFFGENFHRHQPLAELGKIPRHALVAAEDQRFYLSLGFDPIAIAREGWRLISTGQVGSGASTIASQLVKDILGHRRRTVRAKIKEFGYGFYLHRKFSPQELLSAYINRVYLGQRSVGFRAAAWRYFSRPYRQLNSKERLSLIALVPSPSRNNPIYSKRHHRQLTRRFLLRLARRGVLTPKVISAIAKLPLRYDFRQLNPPSSGYFRDYAAAEARRLLGIGQDAPLPKGLTIATGYDSRHHRRMASAIAAADLRPMERRVIPKGTAVQAAALWVDGRSGEIAVMIGGRNYRKSRYNRTALSLRSPGSTLKPIILALAMASGYRLTTRFQNYHYSHHPVKGQRYDPAYLNLSLLEGFTLSSNHLMLRLGETIGLGRFLRRANELGIHTPLKAEWGAIIGSSEVSLFDLARLYSTFAGGGRQPTLHAVRRITRKGRILYEAPQQSEPVLSATIAAKVNYALRQAALTGVGARSEARQLRYGGKTGTSNGMRDNWYCGIVGGRVGVVWVGADQGLGFPGLTGGGSRFALPIWLKSLAPAADQAGTAALVAEPSALVPEPSALEPEPTAFIDLAGGSRDGASDSVEAFFAPLLF